MCTLKNVWYLQKQSVKIHFLDLSERVSDRISFVENWAGTFNVFEEVLFRILTADSSQNSSWHANEKSGVENLFHTFLKSNYFCDNNYVFPENNWFWFGNRILHELDGFLVKWQKSFQCRKVTFSQIWSLMCVVNRAFWAELTFLVSLSKT